MTASTSLDGSKTRDKLLDAAETLVAEIGPEAVSLRQVNLAAGCNVASIHYHFGSKLALVKGVIERRSQSTNHRRQELFAQLGPDSSPADLMRVIVTPMVEFAFSGADQTYLTFLLMLDRAGGEWRDAVLQLHAASANQLRTEYARLFPKLQMETLLVRGHLARVIMLEVLSKPGAFFGYEPSPATVIDTVTSMTVSVLTAPPPEPRSRRPVR